MQIKLLIACEDENRALCLSTQLAGESANGMTLFTTDLATLHAAAASIRPDVLILEHSPVRHEVQQMLPPLWRVHPATRVLLLCESLSDDFMLAFVRLGACGCLLTSDPPLLVAKAVRAVHHGDTWFARSSLVLALRKLVGAAPAVRMRGNEGVLTVREGEIFDLIARGLSNKEVARQLDISDKTVKTHLHRIYVKLRQSGRYKALRSLPSRLWH
ncbi:MAG: response regulator transcription factor [Ramlibacter sp.]|nr:response regulator transcription factor [Ramlibacter sp.]